MQRLKLNPAASMPLPDHRHFSLFFFAPKQAPASLRNHTEDTHEGNMNMHIKARRTHTLHRNPTGRLTSRHLFGANRSAERGWPIGDRGQKQRLELNPAATITLLLTNRGVSRYLRPLHTPVSSLASVGGQKQRLELNPAAKMPLLLTLGAPWPVAVVRSSGWN